MLLEKKVYYIIINQNLMKLNYLINLKNIFSKKKNIKLTVELSR